METLLRAILVASLFAVMCGCKTASVSTEGPQSTLTAAAVLTTQASADVAAIGLVVAKASEDLAKSTAIIEAKAQDIRLIAPPAARPLIEPDVLGILAEAKNLAGIKSALDGAGIRASDVKTRIGEAGAAIERAKVLDIAQEKATAKTIGSLQEEVQKLSKRDVWGQRVFAGIALACFGLAVMFGYLAVTAPVPNRKLWAGVIVFGAASIAAIVFAEKMEAIGNIGLAAACAALVAGCVFLFFHFRKAYTTALASPPPGSVTITSAAPTVSAGTDGPTVTPALNVVETPEAPAP